MIDLESEQLILSQEVTALLPPRRNGKPLHISTVYRWIQRGVRGVRLEVRLIGGTTYTSRQALQRFASPVTMPRAVAKQNSAARQRQIDQAVQRLDEMLYFSKRRTKRIAVFIST